MRTDALVGPFLQSRFPCPRAAMFACAVVVLLGLISPAASAQEAPPAVEPPETFGLDDFGMQPAPQQEDPAAMPAMPEMPEMPEVAGIDDNSTSSTDDTLSLPSQLPDLTSRENLAPAVQLIVLLTVLSLAPAILVLCTSFTRIIIVLSLLRQAIGAQNLPPNQVLIGLALFMTFLVMAPTWGRVNSDALQPYLEGEITQQDALDKGLVPVREFMIAQIQAAGNDDTVLMFQQYARQPAPETWGDVSTLTLIPSFVLSELKVAFLMGFKIYLPFLVIDMVIAAVLISMGMMMLPPVLISLPFKLLLFVLVDGWSLIVGSLMGSFALAGGG